jgi:RimJ/RimL family protein N-acetyltransferase
MDAPATRPGAGPSARSRNHRQEVVAPMPTADSSASAAPGATTASDESDDTLDLDLSPDVLELFTDVDLTAERAQRPAPVDDLLDGVADWGPTDTPVGTFHLVPVRPERDLAAVSRWMNDPAVAEFWQLDGPPEVTERHLLAQLNGDGRSLPCIGVLDGVPMSYWEIYRADLHPVARYYPARPHDTGLHLVIGSVADRARGLGTALLRAAAGLVLEHRPHCGRVIADPELRNTPSVAAFLGAGFRFSAEVDLPGKRAAFMVHDRALRRVLR